MRVEIKRKDLLELLNSVTPIIPSRCSLTQIANVFLKADEWRLVAMCQDLETAITGRRQAVVTEPGEACVLPKPLQALLKSMKSETIVLKSDDKTLTVKADGVEAAFGVSDCQEYPPVPEVKSKESILSLDLIPALKRVQHAICKEDYRPVLAGVFLDSAGEGRVNVVAADGFRLVKTSIESWGKVEPVIISRMAVKMLLKLMPASVYVRQDARLVSFEDSNLTITVRSIEGSYPNYQQLVPVGGLPLTVDADALKGALATISAIGLNAGIVRYTTDRGVLTLVGNDNDGNAITASIPAQGEIKIALNAVYLRDLLVFMDGEMEIESTSPSSPVVVRHGGATEVIMPMFVQW